MARITPLETLPAVDVVRRLGGRAHVTDVLRFTTQHQVLRAVRRGGLLRAARGLYVLPALPEPLLAAARCRGVLSHESAAEHLGLGLVAPPGEVHVTVARGAKPPPLAGVIVHRSPVHPDDVDRGATAHVRTVLDCASTLPFREALAIADSALAARPELAAPLAEAAQRRHGAGRRACLRVVAEASPLAANPFESALRAIALEAGLTGFVPQHAIATRRLGTVRVDLADPVHRIAAEADSFAWHGQRHALAADCFRCAELQRAGWIVVRFAWEHVMFRPEWVAEVLTDLVSAQAAVVTRLASRGARVRRGARGPGRSPGVHRRTATDVGEDREAVLVVNPAR